MPQDDSEEIKVATVDTTSTPALSPEALAAFENLVPLLVEPETLIQGLRYLQQRIPEYVHLTLAQKRSMTRAAHLDPELVDLGIHTAGAWDESKQMFGWTGDDLAQWHDQGRRWAGVEREIHALLEGIAGGNLRRRYTLGTAILNMYDTLRRSVDHIESRAHLRPHLEAMKRAFARVRKAKGRKSPTSRKKDDPEEPA
jgi:hypothetical protein